jgi:hypothetical protein
MLFDLRKHSESLDSLIAWLQTKDPTQRYNYCDPQRCLLCQYFNETFGVPVIATAKNYDVGGWRPLPEHFDEVSYGNTTRADWTFGAALERARACS